MSLFFPNLLEILSCRHPKTLLPNCYLPDLPVLAIPANDAIILISSCPTQGMSSSGKRQLYTVYLNALVGDAIL